MGMPRVVLIDGCVGSDCCDAWVLYLSIRDFDVLECICEVRMVVLLASKLGVRPSKIEIFLIAYILLEHNVVSRVECDRQRM